MVKTQCKHILFNRFLPVHTVIDVVPTATLTLYTCHHTASLRKQIADAVVQHPVGFLVNRFMRRKHFLLSSNRNHGTRGRGQALVDRRIDRFGRRRTDIRTQTNHFIVKEEPSLVCSSIDILVRIHVRISRNPIQAVGHTACKVRGTHTLPVACCQRNFLELGSRHSRYAGPVPRRKDIEVFTSTGRDVRTSV